MKLKSIINTINFLGRQNIALRGHQIQRDVTESSGINEGNLREYIRHRIETCGDDLLLKSHFESASLRTKYISPTIQNELINCCGDEIVSIIIKKVKSSKYYSVIFDETTDISRISQMSLVVRYLEKDIIREDFLGFLDCHAENYDEYTQEPILTGEILGKTVVSFLKRVGLPLEDCIGIGTDTCSVMLSDQKGAVSEIQKSAINAIKCPCYSHTLNLSISKSSNVQDIRNAVGTIKETIHFFNASPKRNKVLKFVNCENLITLSETRWSERHDAVLKFKISFSNIIQALELISQWKDGESSSKAQSLIDTLLKSNFIVSLFCLSHFLSLTVNLSKILQKKNIDKALAQSLIENIISTLNQKRNNVDICFHEIFSEVQTLHEKMGIMLLTPRVNMRQRHRFNVATDNPEDYFRISIFIPLLDDVIQDLNFRFNSELFSALEIMNLLPATLLQKTKSETKLLQTNLAEYLSNVLNKSQEFMFSILESEIDLWINKWKNCKDLPDTALKTFLLCHRDIYPHIHLSLHLICVMPVSVASAERSFSSLKRLKTWLRSTMKQERLVGLALLHAHREVEINSDAVLDRFANLQNRHLDLIL